MKFKREIIAIILIICMIFTISSVFAADSEIQAISSYNSTDEVVSAVNDNEDLGMNDGGEILAETDGGTFAELSAKITGATADSTVDLWNNYTYTSGATAIEITQDNLMIDGHGKTTINANGYTNVFKVSGTGVTIKNIKFINGLVNSGDNGGAINWKGGNGNILNCSFNSNRATGSYDGGAIYAESIVLNLENCTFMDNVATASDSGGAISIYNGKLTIKNSRFIHNTGDVGAITNLYNAGVFDKCIFINNTGDTAGSIYWYTYNSGNLLNSIFLNNVGSKEIEIERYYNGQYYGNVYANGNWWGNTVENNIRPNVANSVVLNSWYLLNITTNGANNIATLALNNLYDGTDIKPSDNYALPSVTFDVEGTNATLNKDNVTLDINGKASFGFTLTEDTGRLTATYNGVSISKDVFDLTDDGSIASLNTKITDAIANGESEVKLYNDYVYDDSVIVTNTIYNGNSNKGIGIATDFTIDGQGFTIDGNNKGGRIIYFRDASKNLILKNINFLNCKDQYGSAVYVTCNNLEIINCTFTDGTATGNPGAAVYSSVYGTYLINNCTFNNNKQTSSSHGGAIAIYVNQGTTGDIINCTFIGNHAKYGGAIFLMPNSGATGDSGNINGCIFKGNVADAGSSAYIYCQGTYVLSNSIILDEDKVICSRQSFDIDNNWWGNTIEDYTNFDVNVIDVNNNKFSPNKWLYLDLVVDNENAIATVSLNNLNDGTVYENYALPKITLNVQATNADINENTITLDENGQATINYEMTDKTGTLTVSYGDVEITKEIKLFVQDSFSSLKKQINESDETTITLNQNYNYNSGFDEGLTNGIVITKSITVDGNGSTIDAKGSSNIFYFDDDTNTKNLILKNIVFANATGTNGAAVYFKGNKIEIINCTFINNSAQSQGDAVYVANANGENKINESLFINNTGSNSVVYVNLDSTEANLNLSDSIFIGNDATYNAKGTSNVVADYNWWGNTAEDYDSNDPSVDGVTLNNWLVLNITANINTNVATVSLNNLYDGNIVRVYENYALPSIQVNIKGTNVTVQKPTVTLDSTGKAVTAIKLLKPDAVLTLSYEDVETNFEIHYVIVYDGSFKELNDIIRFSSENDVIELTKDYVYSDTDTITTGIQIMKTITINGNDHIIDAKGNCGIFLINSPNVVLNDITFKNGVFDAGGAIYCSENAEVLTVDNCTFINNTATSSGGAIYSNAYYDMGSITNSKFINNSAPNTGVIYNYGNNGVIDNCIFINNSGNYIVNHQYSSDYLSNSIFLNNSVSSYNVYKLTSYSWFGNTIDNYNVNIASSSATNWLYLNIKFYEDYAIVSLNNLYTKSSGASSVYSNYDLPEITLNINSTTLNLETDKITLDGNGQARVQYTKISEDAKLTVSNEYISLTKNVAVGDFDTLQGLIDENDEIELDRDYAYNSEDSITEGIIISKNITIDGKGYTIDAKEMTRIFNVQATGVTFKNIIFANGKSNLGYYDGNHGGAIYYNLDNSEKIEFNVINCTFVNNTANLDQYNVKYSGAAIYLKANNAAFNITDCMFVNNDAKENGGAIYLNSKDSEFNLYNSSFIGNKANNGGALYIASDNTTVTIDKCLFRKNTAAVTSSTYGNGILWQTTNDNDKNNVVKNSIFLDQCLSGDNYYAFVLSSGNVNIDENWWGTTAQNHPETFYSFFIGGSITPNAWLFISTDVSSNNLCYNETATIKYVLYSHDGTDISDFDNTKLPYVDFDVSCDKEGLNKDCVSLNEEFTYTANNSGTATIEIYCNNIGYDTYIYGPFIVPRVEVPYTIYANQGLRKNALIKTANGYYNSITISCNDSSLISLGGNYDVTGKTNEGTAKLTFSYDGSYSDYPDAEEFEMVVKVVKVPLNITVTNIESKEITLNVTDTLDLNISFEIDEIHKNYAPAWSTLGVEYNSSVISFDYDNGERPDNGSYYPTGYITARFGGTTNLTFYSTSDKFAFENYTIKITVNKIPTDISLTSQDSFKVDETSNINAVFYSNGTQSTASFVYQSSDEDVVKFTSNAGDFKALANGTAVLTVSFAGNRTHEASSKTLTVTVAKYSTETTIAGDNELSLKVGGQSQITAALTAEDGAELTLTYESSDDSVASVDSNGKITAVGEGTAIITAKYDETAKYVGSSDSLTVTVTRTATAITAQDIEIWATDENVDIGATLNVTGDYTLTYSSNDTANAVLTLTQNGLITAVTEGKVNITISYAGNGTYLPSEKSIIVTVKRVQSLIDEIEQISTRYNEQITITPSVSANGGKITYFIGETQISQDLDLGEAFTFTVDRVGKFNITAKYGGNAKYLPAELNISVTSDKADNIITVVVDDANYPDNITIKLNATVAGTYSVDVNGTVYEVVANGTGKSVKLASGSYYANITGYSSPYYYGITSNDTFTVEKDTNNVHVIVENKYLPGLTTIKVTADIDATYRVVLNDTAASEVLVVVSGGEGTNTVSLPAGRYEANTTFADHQNYTVSIENATFDVNKSDVSIEINIDQITYADNVTGFIKSNVSGTYTVKIVDATFTIDLVKDNHTRFSYSVPLPVASGYYFEVSIAESDDYKAKSANTTFEVVQSSTDFNATSLEDEYTYGEDEIVLAVELPDDATGSVTFNYTSDGRFFGQIGDVTQSKELRIPVLKAGTYDIKATYGGDNNYNSTYKYLSFKVIPAVNHITVSVEDVEYPDAVTVKLTADVEGIYAVDINATTYYVSANDAKGILVKLASGSYYANATYSNENYTADTHNDTFTVNKGVNVVVIDVDDTVLPDDVVVKVTATLPGTYTISINATTVDVEVTSQRKGSNTVHLSAGRNYNATAAFENANYTTIVIGDTFDVNKAVNHILVEAEESGDLTVSVKVTADIGGTYKVNISGKVVEIEANGEGKTINLAAGNYTANVTDYLDDDYEGVITNASFEVSKIQQTISADNLQIDAKDTQTISVSNRPSDAALAFESSDESIAVVDANGKVTAVKSGTATITVSSTGSQNYSDKSIEVTVTVNKISAGIGVGESFEINVDGEKTIEVTKPDDYDGSVSFECNDTSVASVDADGKVTGLAGGTAKITVKANGSDIYDDDAKELTVTVKKITAGISVEEISFEIDVNANRSIIVNKAGFDGTISFTSNDTSVASLDGDGKVTGISGGTAKITVNATGSERYNNESVTVTVKVNMISANLDAGDVAVDVDASKDIAVQLPGDFDGKITYQISNSSIASVDNGIVTGKVGGNATVKITINESAKYFDDAIEINVTVNKIKSDFIGINPNTLNIDVYDSDYFTASDDYGRDLTYESANESIAVIEVDGNSVKVTGVSGGMVNITVTSAESDKYLAESRNVTVTVSKIAELIDADDSLEVDVNANVAITIDKHDFDGDISFTSNDTSVAAVDANGIVTGMKAGNATITITASNSSKFNDVIIEVNVTVKRISPKLNVNQDSINLEVGKNATISVTADSDYDGEITFKLNDTSVAVIENGVITALKGGKVTVTVEASQTDKFTNDSAEILVSVAKLAYPITLDISDITAGENASAIITTSDNGRINITITKGPGIIKSEEIDINGYYKYLVSGLKVGTYNVTARFNGSERYSESEITKEFSVKQIYNYEFAVSVNDTVIGQATNATVTLPDGATGNLVIDGNEVVISSIITLPVQNVAGKNNVTVKYVPDEESDYAPGEFTAYYNVAKKEAEISIEVGNVEIAKDIEITVKSYDGAAIRVSVDGIPQTLTENRFKINATAGVHTIIAAVAESDEYLSASANTTFEVKKLVPTLKVNASDVKVGEKLCIDINITDSATGMVVVNVNGTNHTVYLDSSKSVEVTLDAAGKYDISAKYLGDDIYNAAESDKITVDATEKQESDISVEIPSDIRVGDTITINVTSGNDELEVLINGIAQAVNDGKVEFNVTKAGAYTIVVNANETADYKAQTYVNSFSADKNSAEVVIVLPETIEIGKDIEIAVTSYDGAEITVSVDGAGQTLADNRFTIKATAGVHTIIANVAETDRYLKASANQTFAVAKLDSKITINASDVKVGEKTVIDINITDSATGIVSVNVNGTEYFVNLENAKSLEVVLNRSGKYDITARYLGDDIYNASESNKVTIEATEKAESNIRVEIPSDIKVGQTIVINVTSDNDELEVLINGTVQTLKDGRVEYEVARAGFHPIVVNAAETADCKAQSYENTFTAAKNEASVEISIGDIEIGSDIEITVSSYDGADIRLYVDGAFQTLIYNKAYIKATAGNHTVMATVSESDRYLAASSNATCEVTKKTPAITLTGVDVRVGEKTTITVSTPDFITGIVIVNVNGTDYTVNLDSAKSVEVSLDEVGNYTVTARYLGDDIYAQAESDKITVEAGAKQSSGLAVEIPSDVSVGDVIIITVASDNDDLEVLINGTAQEVINGKVQYEIAASGTYPVVVKAAETAVFAEETYIGAFTASKNPASVEIILPKTIVIGNDIEIAVKSYENADIRAYVDGKAQSVADNRFTIKATAGVHTVIAGVDETDRFMKASANATFTVEKLESSVTVEAADVRAGEKTTVRVNVTDKATGIVIVNVGSQEYSINIENATSVDVVMNDAGKFNVSAKYLGDDLFMASQSQTVTIEVEEKETPNVNVTIPQISAGDDGNITLSIANATGEVYVIVDGVSRIAELDENGTAVIPLEELKAGNHTITVIYAGDENNAMTVESQSFSIAKKDSKVNVNVSGMEPGKDSQIEVSVANATGNVSVIIDGVETTLQLDENGSLNYTLPAMAPGDHSVVVIYGGDDEHAGAYVSKKISVNVSATEFKDIVISSDFKITARLVDEMGCGVFDAVINYTVASRSGSVKTDGEGMFTIQAENNCVADISYAGNASLLATNTSITVNVTVPAAEMIDTSFNVTAGESIATYAVDFAVGERGANYKFRLTDSQGNPIVNAKVQFAYKTVYFNRTTDKNGCVNLGVSTQFAGEYLCALSYLGDETHNAAFVPFSFNVQKKSVTISAAAKKYKASAKTKKYTVTLKTQKGVDGKSYLKSGKKVTLKINGKTYTGKINKNGKVTFKLKITKKGKFVTVIKFAGDKTYQAASKKVTITIK